MFSSEQELVVSIASYVESTDLLRGGERSVFKELNLGYGIADIVGVGYEKNETPRKNFLPYFDISLLSIIEKEERMSLQDMVYITKSPESKIASTLSSLMDEEFIVFRKGFYFSHKKYSDILTDSIAIEAKLKDWKRALKQAYRYKWFSNKSFVFMPNENANPAKENIHVFQQYNVGLATVSQETGVEVIFAPNEEAPVSARMRMALNEHLLFRDPALRSTEYS